MDDGETVRSGEPGTATSAGPWERGRKDTVIAYPGEVTRIKARFDTPGQFVWHCHIVEHEDNEMMRSTSSTVIPSASARRASRFIRPSRSGAGRRAVDPDRRDLDLRTSRGRRAPVAARWRS